MMGTCFLKYPISVSMSAAFDPPVLSFLRFRSPAHAFVTQGFVTMWLDCHKMFSIGLPLKTT